ncbi:hypothetical protein ACRQU7_01555 [Caproiciproducens sp. R1]|uniref:hypothetical protein n=1 Tax=Acutalibacteraceae TaxID=3082771 RepID=UPI002E135A99
MDLDILIYSYVVWAIGLIVIFWVIRAMVSKVVLKPEKAFPSKREFMVRNVKKLNLFARLVGTFLCIVVIWSIVIPGILDLPMVLKGEYVTAYCKATDDDASRKGLLIITQEASFITTNGGKLDLSMFPKGYQKGKNFIVHYLPHMKIGCIAEIIG